MVVVVGAEHPDVFESVALLAQAVQPATSYVVHTAQLAIQFIVHTFDVVTFGSQTESAAQPVQVTTAAVPVPLTEHEPLAPHEGGHYFNTAGVTLVSLYHPGVKVVHLSAVVPTQASHPVGHAVIAAVSKKNLGAAAKQSEKPLPKHKMQLLRQAVIVVTT